MDSPDDRCCIDADEDMRPCCTNVPKNVQRNLSKSQVSPTHRLVYLRPAPRVIDENDPECAAKRSVLARVPRSGGGALLVLTPNPTRKPTRPRRLCRLHPFVAKAQGGLATASVHLTARRPQNSLRLSVPSGVAGGRADYTSKPAAARNWACSATMGEAAHRYNNGDPRFAGMLPPVFFAVDDIGP